jgi:hypothetical protein
MIKNIEKKQLILKEYGELDKEIMSFLCEATYNDDKIKNAIENGKPALIETLRTENMYPPNLYADKIAEAVFNLYQGNSENQNAEITFDDLEWLSRDQEAPVDEEFEEEPEEDIDELIDDDFEEDFDDDDDLNITNSPLKIADDDPGDFDDEG